MTSGLEGTSGGRPMTNAAMGTSPTTRISRSGGPAYHIRRTYWTHPIGETTCPPPALSKKRAPLVLNGQSQIVDLANETIVTLAGDTVVIDHERPRYEKKRPPL